MDRPANWFELVNRPLNEKEIERVKTSIKRDRPLGTDRWIERTVKKLGLEHTIRREGRPKTREEN
ncbi:MAG TPA: hypothetical protein VHS31_01340 [Tepidisphaeraceae bacterium]|nr:hypothetical protein [Tepidisphaeraceae bacterium]